MSIWDDPEVSSSGEYVKFDAVGDTAEGTITAITKKVWDDGKICPQINFTTPDGEEMILTVGQVQLKSKFVEARPAVGDTFKATLVRVEKRAGGKTLKHFDLTVAAGGAGTVDAEVPF